MKHVLINIASVLLRGLYTLFCVGNNKNKKQIVCLSRQQDGSTQDFDLLKQYLTEHYPNYEVVILAKTLNNALQYAPHMITQLREIAKSKAVVLDSYCIVVSLLNKHIKVPVLQMWHALGNMKKFGYLSLDTPEGRSSSMAKALHMHEGYDSVLVSSMSFAQDLAAGFNVPVSLLYEAPLPKVDLLLDPVFKVQEQQKILAALPQLNNGKKNIVYCPTFRRKPAPNETQAMASLIDAVDFEHYNFIFKKHPVSTQVINDPRVIQAYPEELNMLYLADYVISDYSTIIYEAGLLDIPLFLYAYDWDSYSHKRSLNIDLEKDVPTLFTKNPEAIMAAIKHDQFDHQAYHAFTLQNIAVPLDTTCTERIVNHLFDMVRRGKC